MTVDAPAGDVVPVKKFEIKKAMTWQGDKRKKSFGEEKGGDKSEDTPQPVAPPPPPEDGGGMLARLLGRSKSSDTPSAASSGFSSSFGISSDLSSSHGALGGSDDIFMAFKNSLAGDTPFNALDEKPPDPEPWTTAAGDEDMGDTTK